MDCLSPLLAQAAALAPATSDASTAERILSSMPWFGWIAIVAMVVGGVNTLVAGWIRHVERMALIRQGINPDAPAAVDPNAKPPHREHAEF